MVNEAKYKKWFFLDSLLIVCMWLFLVLSETYVVYSIMNAALSRGLEMPPLLIGLFILVLILMFVINGLGCLNVWKSIKQHMYEFTYYD